MALLSPILAGVAVYRWASGIALRQAFRYRWHAKGRVGILVYSDSPNWKEYFERDILPKVGDRFVVLNWSQRAEWPRSLEVIAFRRWAGERDFNPMAVVFGTGARPLILRFRPAFKDLKRGRPDQLRALEQALLREAGAA